jgi:hypothetical protein
MRKLIEICVEQVRPSEEMPKSSAGAIASGAAEHSFRRLRVNLAGTQ